MFDEVNVFTLGDTSCLLSFGLVSANGVMYWVSKDTRSVMSFDHKDERVAFVTTLPDAGLAVCSYELKRGRTFKGSKTEGTSHFKSSPGLTSPMVIGEHGERERLVGLARVLAAHGRGKDDDAWPPAISLYDDYCVHGPYAKTTEPFIRTFAYVETTEPLALYGYGDSDGGIGYGEWQCVFDDSGEGQLGSE
ncbi:hypothetical protein HU200_012299 [Digitaria exilis]|uniref:Uncharacterized protein n=1 Tax=Digitaria exilis TaxID=1010633 RepID=A0A835FF56_9POAL|nr:hypothetical protein HU200_012299 [Digitaria exilis]